MNLWALALRNLLRNRRRSGLTLGVVVFGFAAFALAGGFMLQSFDGLKRGTIRGGIGHLQLVRPEALRGAEDTPLRHGLRDAAAVTARAQRDARVDAVLPRIDFMGLLSNGARSVPYLGVGLDPVAEARVMEIGALVGTGRWLRDRDELGVVLGSGLARALDTRVGDTLTLLGTTTAGVLNALDVPVVGLADIPVRELNDRYLATTLATASRLLDAQDTVSKVVIMLKRDSELDQVKHDLLAALAADGMNLKAQTWRDLAIFYSQVRLLYIGIFGFMGLILVIMVLLACANTMTMAITERTREIGTLRAIGTPAARIRRLFIVEGILLGLLGSLAGLALTLVARAALNAAGITLPPPPGLVRGSLLHVAIYPQAYAAGGAAMVLTLTLAAYFPARRAARLSIVEALAHV